MIPALLKRRSHSELRVLLGLLVCVAAACLMPVPAHAAKGVLSGNVDAGSTDNRFRLQISNPTDVQVDNLRVVTIGAARYVRNLTLTPASLSLAPGESRQILATFDIDEDAPNDAQDKLRFHVQADTGVFDPWKPEVHLNIKNSEDEDEDGPAERDVACNSAVKAGANKPETVNVDLQGFSGKAGFSWNTYSVPDQIIVNYGGPTYDTGCVGASDSVEFDIPPGASQVTVQVIPNCDNTNSTAWDFRFDCPVQSEEEEEVPDEVYLIVRESGQRALFDLDADYDEPGKGFEDVSRTFFIKLKKGDDPKQRLKDMLARAHDSRCSWGPTTMTGAAGYSHGFWNDLPSYSITGGPFTDPDKVQAHLKPSTNNRIGGSGPSFNQYLKKAGCR